MCLRDGSAQTTVLSATLTNHEIMRLTTLKGSIRIIFLQSPHCAANCLQHVRKVARAQPCANHVQHIQRSSRATCRVPRGTKGQLIYFNFILLAEPLTDEGREETGVPGENP